MFAGRKSILLLRFVMAEIVIVVDGPEPLDLDWLVFRVLLVLVPDSEPAFLGGTASDVDVRLGHSCGV